MAATNFKKRGERLIRLAYDLEKLAADARYDGLGDVANGLKEASDAARFAGDAYIERAKAGA